MNIPVQFSLGGSRMICAIDPYAWSIALLPGFQFLDVAVLHLGFIEKHPPASGQHCKQQSWTTSKTPLGVRLCFRAWKMCFKCQAHKTWVLKRRSQETRQWALHLDFTLYDWSSNYVVPFGSVQGAGQRSLKEQQFGMQFNSLVLGWVLPAFTMSLNKASS